MSDHLLALLTVGVVAGAAAGWGVLLLGALGRGLGVRLPRARAARWWLALVAGLGLVGHMVLLLGLFHVLSRGWVLGVLAGGWAGGIGLGVRPCIRAAGKRRAASAGPGNMRPGGRFAASLDWVGAAAAGIAVLSLLPPAGWPPASYDVLEYHLQAPRIFLAQGSLEGDAHNFFTRLPLQVELLTVAGNCVLPPQEPDARAAKWMAVFWGALFAWGCGELARRLGVGRAGRFGAVALGAALPLTGKVTLDVFNDAGAAVFGQLFVFGWLGLASSHSGMDSGENRSGERRRRKDWIWAGAGAGWAVSCKWGVLVHLVIPGFALLLLALGARRLWAREGGRGRKNGGGRSDAMWRQGPLPSLVAAGVLALAVFSPWMLRAGLATGNPVFPWGTALFASEEWNADQEKFLLGVHGPQRPWQAGYWHKVGEGVRVVAPTLHVGTGAWMLPVGALALCGLWLRRRGRTSGGAGAGAGTGTGTSAGAGTGAGAGAFAGTGGPLLWGLVVAGIGSWALVRHAPDRFLLPVAGFAIPGAVAGCEALRRWRAGGSAGESAGEHAGNEKWSKGLARGLVLLLAAAALIETGGRVRMYAGDPLVRVAWAGAEGRDMAARELLGAPVADLALAARREQKRLAGEGRTAKFLILYEARGWLFPMPHTINTVFDHAPLMKLAAGAATSEEINAALAQAGYTHVVLNEAELHRLVMFYGGRRPGEEQAKRGQEQGEGRAMPGGWAMPEADFSKRPGGMYPYLGRYWPHAMEPRFSAREEALARWQAGLLDRAVFRATTSRGLVICLTPLGE